MFQIVVVKDPTVGWKIEVQTTPKAKKPLAVQLPVSSGSVITKPTLLNTPKGNRHG